MLVAGSISKALPLGQEDLTTGALHVVAAVVVSQHDAIGSYASWRQERLHSRLV